MAWAIYLALVPVVTLWAMLSGWRTDRPELTRCGAVVLAHSDDSVRAAYNSALYLEQRRGMLQAWADRLDEWRIEGMWGLRERLLRYASNQPVDGSHGVARPGIGVQPAPDAIYVE